MTQSTPTNSRLRAALRQRGAIVLSTTAMVLLFQVSCMDFGRVEMMEESFAGGDGYTWSALVDGWRVHGKWRPIVPAHNAPYGLETHWTMPFAALVRGLAQPLRLRLAPAEADRVAGKLSGPMLHIASAIALALGSRALLGTGGTMLVVIGFLFMPQATTRFGVHMFDHHGLHLFLTALNLALLLHHAVQRRGRLAAAAGVVAGVGIWTGVEMLIPAGIGGLALGLAWVGRGGKWRAQGLKFYSTGMAIALAIAVMAEFPASQWTSLATDRVSGIHVLVATLLAAATGAIAWLQGRWPDIAAIGRLGAGVLAGGGVIIATLATVPDFLLGPYGTPDPVVSEHLQGLPSDQGIFLWFVSMPVFLGFHLCLALLVAAAAFAGLRSTSSRDAYVVLATGALAGAVAAFVQYRLIHHYEMFACVALGAAAAAAGRFVWETAPTIMRAAAAPVALFVMVTPFLGSVVGNRFAPATVHESWEAAAQAAQNGECEWGALGRALARLPGKHPGTIATYAPPGPELAHFSGRGVVATGSHCNAEGMRDARAILLETPASARVVAKRRGVEFIVQCPSARGWQGHGWYVERSGPDGVYARLASGNPPAWLVRVPAAELGLDEFVVWRTAY